MVFNKIATEFKEINKYFYFVDNQPKEQINNPLHGLTLETILTDLVAFVGWEKMALKVPIKCFESDPSIKSSLTFLRKTPWARKKVEVLYEFNIKRIQKGKAEQANQ